MGLRVLVSYTRMVCSIYVSSKQDVNYTDHSRMMLAFSSQISSVHVTVARYPLRKQLALPFEEEDLRSVRLKSQTLVCHNDPQVHRTVSQDAVLDAISLVIEQ